jgi:hypothetical protein
MRHFRAISCCALVLTIGVASAEPARDDPSDHFRRAVEALRAQDRAGALAEFRAAETLAPAPTTLWNIVVLEIELGMTREAHRDLLAYRELASGAMSAERAETVRKTLDDLERKLARVRVELTPKEASFRIDDVDAEGAAWVVPGEHVLEARAPGFAPKRETLALDAGATTEIRWDLVPLPASPLEVPAPSGPAPGEGRDGRKTASYIVGGAGVAFVGVGVYAGLQAFRLRSESDGLCPTDATCQKNGRELNESAYRSALISDIGFGAGAVLLGTATYLFLSSGGSSSAPKRPAGASTFRAQIVPTPAGIVAVGTL